MSLLRDKKLEIHIKVDEGMIQEGVKRINHKYRNCECDCGLRADIEKEVHELIMANTKVRVE